MLIMFLLVFLSTAASAVEVAFRNCASAGSLNESLFFRPTGVNAVYSKYNSISKSDQDALTFTVYGYMTGTLDDLNPDTNKYSE